MKIALFGYADTMTQQQRVTASYHTRTQTAKFSAKEPHLYILRITTIELTI